MSGCRHGSILTADRWLGAGSYATPRTRLGCLLDVGAAPLTTQLGDSLESGMPAPKRSGLRTGADDKQRNVNRACLVKDARRTT